MGQWPIWLITLGSLFFLGLAADQLGRRTLLPRATLLLCFGFAIGPSAFDLLPDLSKDWFPRIADVALVMIGFLLGGGLTRKSLRENGRSVITISLSVVIITAIIMFVGLKLFGVPDDIALILSAVAVSTAPMGTSDVVRQTGASGEFTDTLLGIVAVDDAWGLILFSFLLMIAVAVSGNGMSEAILINGIHELGGAVLVGVIIGIPVAYLTGRVQSGEPTLVEALGAVFLCAGVALWLQVSHLLAAMVMGIVVANIARHHERPFHAIEGIDWPFKVLFFVLAGAALQPELLLQSGWIGLVYIVLRFAGRIVGVHAGGWFAGYPAEQRNWMGLALMPQAGVALGMVLVAGQHLPHIADMLITLVVGVTVVFEVIGPILTRLSLSKLGEIKL